MNRKSQQFKPDDPRGCHGNCKYAGFFHPRSEGCKDAHWDEPLYTFCEESQCTHLLCKPAVHYLRKECLCSECSGKLEEVGDALRCANCYNFTPYKYTVKSDCKHCGEKTFDRAIAPISLRIIALHHDCTLEYYAEKCCP